MGNNFLNIKMKLISSLVIALSVATTSAHQHQKFSLWPFQMNYKDINGDQIITESGEPLSMWTCMTNRVQEWRDAGYESDEELRSPNFFTSFFTGLHREVLHACKGERYLAGFKIFGNQIIIPATIVTYHYDCTAETLRKQYE